MEHSGIYLETITIVDASHVQVSYHCNLRFTEWHLMVLMGATSRAFTVCGEGNPRERDLPMHDVEPKYPPQYLPLNSI